VFVIGLPFFIFIQFPAFPKTPRTMHRITYPYNCPLFMVQKWGSIPHEVGCFRFLAGIVLEMVALGLGRKNEKIQSNVVLRSTTLDISQRSIFVFLQPMPCRRALVL
jgi:hypothetical protein